MRHHRASVVTAPGVAQATYDAVAAKLVSVGSWLDLTATITTACAGAAASDPDSLAAGLTVTTTTGTFDGATVDCNSFAWTTHSTTNDGHGETLNYDLGTLASLLTGYDPATYGVQIVADLVATGTLNSARPILSVAIAKNGTIANTAPAAGIEITAATTVYGVSSLTSASYNVTGGINPTGQVVQVHTRHLPLYGSAARWVAITTLRPAAAPYVNFQITDTFTTSDKLILCLGQSNTTSGAVSGIKIRFRVRLVPHANLDLSDLDLGCQA
jgi:hypothetical protein